ncbi:hypothetical protein [Micromonospora sp. NPDC048830]|uniref:hypothetical protein n=1 Tax=Micromonospora sp. NPDC048830 TaxID=3364257 RepID=UPI00371C01DE
MLVIDGEWGRVEEVKLTHVVVRLWDDRMLILPHHLLHRTAVPELDQARGTGGRPGPPARGPHRRPRRPSRRGPTAGRGVTALGPRTMGPADGRRDPAQRGHRDPGVRRRRPERLGPALRPARGRDALPAGGAPTVAAPHPQRVQALTRADLLPSPRLPARGRQ